MKKEKDKKKKREKHAEQTEIELLDSKAVPIQKQKDTGSDKDPLKTVVDTIGGKWKILILWALREKNGRRYGEIKGEIANITDMMLSQSLRELTADDLVERQQFQEIPPRVEYKITPSGLELLPALTLLREWGVKRVNK